MNKIFHWYCSRGTLYDIHQQSRIPYKTDKNHTIYSDDVILHILRLSGLKIFSMNSIQKISYEYIHGYPDIWEFTYEFDSDISEIFRRYYERGYSNGKQ